MLKAAESIKGWSDGLVPNISMGPAARAPVEDMKVVEVRNGQIARDLTGWIRGSRPKD